MRLACIAPFGFAPKNTTGRRLLPMARALAARGHDVRVIVPPYDDPANYGRAWKDAGVEIVCLKRPRLAGLPVVGQAYTQWALARQAVAAVLAGRPDLVHVFKPKAVSGLAQHLLWRRARRPCLVLDTDDWEGKAGWSAYEDYPRWQAEVFDWQERSGLRRCDAVSAASRTLEERARRLPAAVPVVHLPNGFDPQTYANWRQPVEPAVARRKLGFAGDQRVVLIYTRFFEYPVDAWVDVIGRLARADALTHFAVLGSGKYGQESALASRLHSAGLAGRVRFLGWVAFDDLPTVFAAADVGLLAMTDTLANRSKCSLKFTDLMSAGVPVVATPVGEATTYVRDGETGFLAADDSPAALAAATLRALTARHRVARSERAREHATRELAWERLVAPLDELYAMALERAAARRPD